LLVYGRRKTGKTFLLKRYLDWDIYVTVGRGGFCIVEYKGGRMETFSLSKGFKDALNRVVEGMVVVVDEFQRAPEWLWDYIAVLRHKASGRLVLCGSSLSVARRVFDRRSPLLGLFAPVKIDVITPADAIYSLSRKLRPREAVLWALLARDPWILGLIEPSGDPIQALARSHRMLSASTVGLIGEVFEEEERKLTRLYDAVLRLLADGYWSSRDMAQKLFEAGLLERPEAGVATGLLNQMVELGLVEKIPLWRTRGARVYYRHRSNLVSLLLYMDEKYGEAGIEPRLEPLSAKLGLELQFFIGELLASYRRLQRAYTVAKPVGDIDVILLDKDKPIIGYEVKIGEIGRSEARKTLERMRRYGIPRTGLVSLTEKPPEVADESLGPQEIVEIAEKTFHILRQNISLTRTTK